MAKVNIKSEIITPFGVIYYASKAFYALSLDKVINGTPGVRSSTYNGYQWDKELSHEDLEYKSSSGNVFRFNTNPRLNDLLMKLNMKMGLFKSGQNVNVDFDHVFVKTGKADAKYSYKQVYGYFPGVVSINGIIAVSDELINIA